jgi:hypothetical protein
MLVHLGDLFYLSDISMGRTLTGQTMILGGLETGGVSPHLPDLQFEAEPYHSTHRSKIIDNYILNFEVLCYTVVAD